MVNSDEIFKIKQEITQIRLKNQECRDRLIHLGELIDILEKEKYEYIEEVGSFHTIGTAVDCFLCQYACEIKGRTEIFCLIKDNRIREGNFKDPCPKFLKRYTFK